MFARHPLVVALAASFFLGTGAPADTPNNIYGAHTFLQDIMAPSYIESHLDWVRTLTGPGGYVKQLIYPIYPWTTTSPSWQQFVQGCYDRDLIPVLRLATYMYGGTWIKPQEDAPGDYTTAAAAIRHVVSGLPRDDRYPLYVEVLNEPNNSGEWSGQTPDPVAYGTFLVQVSSAIRSLSDPRIKIMNAGLSPGGTYDNVAYVEQMCLEVPGFLDSFDVWASHPYAFNPPEINHHDGTASPNNVGTIDSYVLELDVLERYGRSGVKVIGTEGGYQGGSEDGRADQMMRAFRDYYSKWPEVLAMTPWEFCNPHTFDYGSDWVYNDSTGSYPSHTHKIYDSVYQLSKVWMDTGTISGKTVESIFGSPLSGVTVTLNPGGASRTTDSAGNYMFPDLSPGVYSVTASKTNYAEASRNNIGVSAAENEVTDFELTATSSSAITGTIRDSLSGQPLQGVLVTADPGGYTATTEADGIYLFEDLAPSTYTVRSEKYGYYSFANTPVTITAGEAHHLDWVMGPGAPPPGQNLLGGGERENADHWSTIDGQPHPEIYSIDTSSVYSGRGSQKIMPDGSSVNQMWQMTNYSSIISGRTYRIEAWVKVVSPSGLVRVQGNFFSNDTIQVSSFMCTPALSTPTGWTRFAGYAVAPGFSTQNRGRLQVELVSALSAGAAWFDNIWAGEDTTAQSPVGSPYNLTVVPNTASGSLNLAWVHGTTPGTAGTKLVLRTDRYPLTPADGTPLADVAGSPGTTGVLSHTGAQWGKRYYYSAFSYGPGGGSISRPVFATGLLVDTTAPTPPAGVTDEGDYTFSSDSLACSWTAANDPQSGIAGYRFRIGTSVGSGDVVDWTSTGTETTTNPSGLLLTPGVTYYFEVQAQNGHGDWSVSTFSDGITAGLDVRNIAEAKLQPDGYVVRVLDVNASSGAADFAERIYVSEPDRSAGIQLFFAGQPPTVSRGQLLDVIGRMTTLAGERSMADAALILGDVEVPVVPLGISAAHVAGIHFAFDEGPPPSGQQGVATATAINNVGLLVRVWGRVIDTGADHLVIDDSSRPGGLRIDSSMLGSAGPAPGSIVMVTGISSIEYISGIWEPIVRVRCPEDLATL